MKQAGRRFRYKVTRDLYDFVRTMADGNIELRPANAMSKTGDLVGHLIAAPSELEEVTYDPDGDWLEMHLTARGWERGSESNGNGDTITRSTPEDRVKTVRLCRATDEVTERYSGHDDEVGPLIRHWGPWP